LPQNTYAKKCLICSYLTTIWGAILLDSSCKSELRLIVHRGMVKIGGPRRYVFYTVCKTTEINAGPHLEIHNSDFFCDLSAKHQLAHAKI